MRKKKKVVLENRNTNRKKPENRLFGARSRFGSLMAEAISFALFQVSAVQVQDHKCVAALVPKINPQDKQISFKDREKFRRSVFGRIGLIVVKLEKGLKKKNLKKQSKAKKQPHHC